MAIARGEGAWYRYIPEVTWGTSPTTGTMTPVGLVTDSTKYNRTKTPNPTIVSHGNIVNFIRGTSSISGSSNHILRYGEFDTFFESALASAWSTNVLTNGQTESSMSIERGYSDVDQYHLFSGLRGDGFSMSMSSDQRKVDLTFNYVGKTEDFNTGTGADWVTTNAGVTLGANPAAALDAMYLQCAELKIDNVAFANATSIDLNVSRGLQPIDTVDCDDPVEISRTQQIAVTGSMNSVISDETIYSKFINDTSFTLDLTLTDGVSTYLIVMDNVQFTDDEQPIAGPGDILNNATFQAIYDATLTGSIQITRTP